MLARVISLGNRKILGNLMSRLNLDIRHNNNTRPRNIVVSMWGNLVYSNDRLNKLKQKKYAYII